MAYKRSRSGGRGGAGRHSRALPGKRVVVETRGLWTGDEAVSVHVGALCPPDRCTCLHSTSTSDSSSQWTFSQSSPCRLVAFVKIISESDAKTPFRDAGLLLYGTRCRSRGRTVDRAGPLVCLACLWETSQHGTFHPEWTLAYMHVYCGSSSVPFEFEFDVQINGDCNCR